MVAVAIGGIKTYQLLYQDRALERNSCCDNIEHKDVTVVVTR